jgi:hypothetical protein
MKMKAFLQVEEKKCILGKIKMKSNQKQDMHSHDFSANTAVVYILLSSGIHAVNITSSNT